MLDTINKPGIYDQPAEMRVFRLIRGVKRKGRMKSEVSIGGSGQSKVEMV